MTNPTKTEMKTAEEIKAEILEKHPSLITLTDNQVNGIIELIQPLLDVTETLNLEIVGLEGAVSALELQTKEKDEEIEALSNAHKLLRELNLSEIERLKNDLKNVTSKTITDLKYEVKRLNEGNKHLLNETLQYESEIESLKKEHEKWDDLQCKEIESLKKENEELKGELELTNRLVTNRDECLTNLQSQLTLSNEKAVRFAEWIGQAGYRKYHASNRWKKFSDWDNEFVGKDTTTQELYSIFLETKEQGLETCSDCPDANGCKNYSTCFNRNK